MRVACSLPHRAHAALPQGRSLSCRLGQAFLVLAGAAGLALLPACPGPDACAPVGPLDPQLRAQLDAEESWAEGRAALDQGRAADAVLAFIRAEELDPGSPNLPAWRAWALELSGDDAAALQVLDAALSRFPRDELLRFNRAALYARLGDHSAAGQDLRTLQGQGQLDVAAAGADPDLIVLSQLPSFASLVVPARVELSLSGETGSVLVGDRYDAELRIDAPLAQGLPASRLAVEDMGQPSGLLRRVRVVEDLAPSPTGHVIRTLALTWQAVAPGKGALGPWLVTSGGVSALSSPLQIEVLAVGQRSGAVGRSAGESLVIPSQALADHDAPWLGVVEDALVVMVPIDARVDVVPASGAAPLEPDEVWELRDEGRPRWRGLLFHMPVSAHIYATQGAKVLLDQTWPAR